MKKVFFLIFLVNSVFANIYISDDELISECTDTGVKAVMEQAKSFDCDVKEDEIKVVDIDNRWYNPHKYLWFSAPTDCGDKEKITKLIQYYSGNCF